MKASVSLRAVEPEDLPVFFAHQLDPEATRLAAFPSRQREAFFAHWRTNILGNPAAVSRTVLADSQVAGNVGAWTDPASHDRFICYWIGREFWGRGIASAALSQFLGFESQRPLHARVAKHNAGSIRVLEKSGFIRTGEETFPLPDGGRLEELSYLLSG